MKSLVYMYDPFIRLCISDDDVLIHFEQIFYVPPDSLALHSMTDREATGRLSAHGQCCI